MNPDKFSVRSPADVARLVRDYPLAWIVSGSADGPCATLLPVQAIETGGQIERLVGHFARSNSHVRALQRDPRAIVLCLGPHGYISPSWMADRTQAPTWNYASSQFIVEVKFFDNPADIDAHLRDLVSAMEAGREGAWNIDDMGERYRSLSRGVIGFTASVREVRAKFKLGQDERDDVFEDIVRGLGRQDESALLDLMLAFSEQRPWAPSTSSVSPGQSKE